MRNFSISLCLG